MGKPAGGERPPVTEDVAAYVAIMARELKELVAAHELRSLAYLLDLVCLEAEERARGPDPLHAADSARTSKE